MRNFLTDNKVELFLENFKVLDQFCTNGRKDWKSTKSKYDGIYVAITIILGRSFSHYDNTLLKA